MLTKEQVYRMKEDELRDSVLVPLLQKLGFQGIFVHHGSGELGKDIVCWMSDALNSRVNYAIVAKAVPITGRSAVARGTTGEVLAQVLECFGENFLGKVDGEKQVVHQCWIVSSKEIGKHARDAMMAGLRAASWDRNIRFVDGDDLWNLVEEHLLGIWAQASNFRQQLDQFDALYYPEFHLTSSGTHITLAEKVPGAFEEQPIRWSIQNLDTPEGLVIREAVEHHQATGSPVTIPMGFVQAEFPDSIKTLLEPIISNKDYVLQLISRPDPIHFPVRAEFHCDDGDNFILNYVDLKVVQSGEEEITLSNDDQALTVKAKLIINRKNQRIRFDCKLKVGCPINVYQLLSLLRLQKCMSKPVTMRLIPLETGIPIEGQRSAGTQEPPDPEFMKLIEDLVAIQLKVKRPLVLPDRAWTQEEEENVSILRTILHTGRLRIKIREGSVSIRPEGVHRLLESRRHDKADWLTSEREEAVELFGVELPLGRVRVEYAARLINEPEIRERLAQLSEEAIADETAIELKFAPAEDEPIEAVYLDWQDAITSNTIYS